MKKVKVKVSDIAQALGSSEETVRQLMLKGVPWGEVLQREGSMTKTYLIYPGKAAEYFGEGLLKGGEA